MGFTDLIFELCASEAKIKGVMVTDYIKLINKTYLAIICLSDATILLSLSDTEWFYNSIKRQGL